MFSWPPILVLAILLLLVGKSSATALDSTNKSDRKFIILVGLLLALSRTNGFGSSYTDYNGTLSMLLGYPYQLSFGPIVLGMALSLAKSPQMKRISRILVAGALLSFLIVFLIMLAVTIATMGPKY